jgi:hypothetical protein
MNTQSLHEYLHAKFGGNIAHSEHMNPQRRFTLYCGRVIPEDRILAECITEYYQEQGIEVVFRDGFMADFYIDGNRFWICVTPMRSISSTSYIMVSILPL